VAYRIDYRPLARADLLGLPAGRRAAVLDRIEARLRRDPLRDPRDCEPLRPNRVAGRELRVVPQRVLYDADPEARVVTVRRVLTKPGGVYLDSAGREVDLDG
jgi:mRNA-degrading endonuclease RelE of RelBE toxin-antitoxin system